LGRVFKSPPHNKQKHEQRKIEGTGRLRNRVQGINRAKETSKGRGNILKNGAERRGAAKT